MAETGSTDEILVCGYAAERRVIRCILPMLNDNLSVKGAHTKDKLIEELSRGRQPICIMEHCVHLVDPVEELKNIIGEDKIDILEFATHGQIPLAEEIIAYDLLPELLTCSPNTKFVITSHTRGFGVSPEQRALYKQRPEVLKVMGFINAQGNSNYLLKLLCRVYAVSVKEKL